jgi:drug/metabolite transporter (DMT)-like permease
VRRVGAALVLATGIVLAVGVGGLSDPLGVTLLLLALQGIGLSYLGTMLWYLTIARLDLARATAIVVPSIPLLSLVASFFVVGEVPTLRQAVGMLLTAGGVLAFVTAPHAVEERERVPAQTAPLATPADPETGGDQA